MFFLLFTKHTPGKSWFQFEHADKVAHFGLFGGWSFLFYFGFAQYFNRKVLWALLVSLFFAISTEIIQYFIPHRDADWLDGMADMVGSTVGVLFAFFVKKELNRVGKEL
ncbi:VanZ family protein [Marinoscillum pacificum]|uniref:VanZ family protein n=1 Tax=Marinoscillum pacificum TaxID=392723 RepID=UPI00358FAA7A